MADLSTLGHGGGQRRGLRVAGLKTPTSTAFEPAHRYPPVMAASTSAPVVVGGRRRREDSGLGLWLTEYQRQFTWKRPFAVVPAAPSVPGYSPSSAVHPKHGRSRSPSLGGASTAPPPPRRTLFADAETSTDDLLLATADAATEVSSEIVGGSVAARSIAIQADTIGDGDGEVEALPVRAEHGRLGATWQAAVGGGRRAGVGEGPLLFPFGAANTKPPVDELYMKTFNVRAPYDQVYPSSLARRLQKVTEPGPAPASKFVHRPAATGMAGVFAGPDDAVKHGSGPVPSRYQTEYQREFLDWMAEMRRLRSSGLPAAT